MKKLIPLLLLLGLFSCNKENTTNQEEPATSKNEELHSLFEEISDFLSSPEDSLYYGHHVHSEWASVSESSQIKDAENIQQFITQLEAISNESLGEQDLISKKVMLIRLKDMVDAVNYKMNLIPFNAEGGFYNQMAFVIPNLPFDKTEHYIDYLGWLPNYHNRLKENIALVKKGLELGVVAPKIVVQNNIQLLQPWLDLKNNVLYQPLKKMENVVDTENAELMKSIENELIAINTTLKEFDQLMRNEYMAAAKEQPGIMFVPEGKSYYENRVKHYSTLPLTPDSVHNLGLSEVARIRSQMDKIIEELKFEGSFEDFLKFLRTDEQFYPKTPQELLNYAAWLSKKAEGQLPKLFDHLYSLPFTVEPVPMSIAPTYTTGRYVGGSWEAHKAGIYWVNTYNLPSRTLYTLPALTLHEAVPGHHLQGAIAGELDNIPEFRNNYYISAFGEGWGLYSEYLGEEMGMYETPYDLFGRYTYEMWRACRLVVDTGIHYKGWTRQQALDYMANNTALSIHEVTTEIDRYIGWPGQAISYKIGEIKIKALRKKAEDALGEDFNIREFHHVILKNGSIPLAVLEEQVDGYISRTKI
ncbi:DUF885 domain-containing protein [Fulvivirga lutea]|uniref:DUF885 domain-containing protein n=1 Tax=Fulvivirga lutea TaxID=2810512 RepID=A0A974WFY9_9BACT|nr:DUF885 domain-containing protein [Fulvivirga lutea]QSE96332.1 DUF885 domain-containing protein [Fulvivirga lutea]